jgi:hypothetical protein
LTPNYLLSHERGLAADPDPMSNYGIELSRGFKALKGLDELVNIRGGAPGRHHQPEH